MKTKVLVGLAWLVVSGYIVALCFRGMNLASDATYIAGIAGLAVWFVVITPVLARKLFKEKKHDEKVAAGAVTGYVCRVLARGSMNSCLVVFADGFKMVTSRNALRRL
jgi:hypothetical protein